MERRRILAWFMRNVRRKNKLTVLCVLGFLWLVYLNPDTNVKIDHYKLMMKNYTLSAPSLHNKVQPKSPPIPAGYQLASAVRSLCSNQNESFGDQYFLDNSDHITVRFSRHRDVMFCPVYKVGSTFWRRVFMMQADGLYKHVHNPYQLPFDKEFKSGWYNLQDDIRSNFTFMFTRDPYSRLFSTYVDKLLAPNPYYWKVLGQKIIKFTRNVKKPSQICGHDVTFPEFIKYVIHSLSANDNIDPHFVQMDQNCRPCDVQYDFIGKMEAFASDSAICLDKLDLHGVVELLKTNGSELSAQDAMLDTMTQPFSFRKQYWRCMSFSEALHRSWKKLQIRGLIGNVSLDLRTFGKDLRSITLPKVISLARESHENTISATRKRLKQDFYEFYWRQIDISDLYILKSLYSTDFTLFNYDPEPTSVYQHRTF